jgi:enoyl-CoA hydratase/carnithine racemase
MTGAVLLEVKDSLAFVTLSHPGKLNAMSRAMWRELRAIFERIQQAADSLRAGAGRERAFLRGRRHFRIRRLPV